MNDNFELRYALGNGIVMWNDYVACGVSAVKPDMRAETHELARRTMKVVRDNLERLMAGLDGIGYEFQPAPGNSILAESGIPAAELDDLEKRIGPMPVALRAFAEVIGSVSLAGRHEHWDGHVADPLILTFSPDYFYSEFDEFVEAQGTEYERPEFTIELAPDHLHKANISGGLPISMVVPYLGADALLRGERHMTTMVNYLRIALRWGGFPGWDPALDEQGTGLEGPWPDDLRRIAAEMKPF